MEQDAFRTSGHFPWPPDAERVAVNDKTTPIGACGGLGIGVYGKQVSGCARSWVSRVDSNKCCMVFHTAGSLIFPANSCFWRSRLTYSLYTLGIARVQLKLAISQGRRRLTATSAFPGVGPWRSHGLQFCRGKARRTTTRGRIMVRALCDDHE